MSVSVFVEMDINMKIKQPNSIFYPRVTRKLLATILLGISLSAGAVDRLTVRAGQTGYLGEIYPTTKLFTSYLHPSSRDVSSDPRVVFPALPVKNDYIAFVMTNSGSFAEYDSVYGVKLVNENDSSRTIVLLFNGSVSVRFKGNAGNNVTKTAVLQKSKQISGNLVQTRPLTWALEGGNTSRPNYFYPAANASDGLNQVNITSLSAYSSSIAGGDAPVVKGRYKLPQGTAVGFGVIMNLYRPGSGWVFLYPYILDNESLSVEALESCTVQPITTTNIIFSNQHAGLKQNQLLETKPASMNVNCVTAGRLLMVVSANQPLHGQTGTGNTSDTNLAGMALDSLSGNTSNSTERPYIVTSKVAPTPDICRNGNSNAIEYYERIKLGNMSANNTKETVYFNLCHNGNVKAGSYRGSIDVAFFLE